MLNKTIIIDTNNNKDDIIVSIIFCSIMITASILFCYYVVKCPVKKNIIRPIQFKIKFSYIILVIII